MRLATAGMVLAVAGIVATAACGEESTAVSEPLSDSRSFATTSVAATAAAEATATPPKSAVLAESSTASRSTAFTQGDAAPTASPSPAATSSHNWRGLEVAPEDRCAPYDADDYSYSQSVEQRVVADMGGIVYGPYTGTWFASTTETDIEHIVARSEAHDSGLCAADAETRRRFATDVLNLTLASPAVNRSQKSGKDAAEWLPDLNRCWFANRVVEVRRKYGLTIDQRERDSLENILSGCTSTSMIVERTGQGTAPTPVPSSPEAGSALQLYDDNGNGRITCAEARRHGIAPVSRGHPAYEFMNDGDGDGIVCE